MHYLNVLILTLLIFSSCSEEPKKKQPLKVESHLSQKDFYQLFKVKGYQKDRNEFRLEAKEIFYKGIQAYKNNQDLDSGLIYLEQAIRKYPTANAYYELGNILKDQDRNQEALQAYQVAEGLGYEPLGSVLIQMSRAHAKLKQIHQAGEFLLAAIQGGYTNKKLIEGHPDYKDFLDSWQYTENLKRGFSGLSEPDKFEWFQFKKQFPLVSLPLSIPTDFTTDDFQNMAYISYDFEPYVPGMRDAKFAREVGVGHYFYANIMENENFVACLYIAHEENYYYEEEDEYEELYATLLCTYDPKGKIIDLKKIAGRREFDDFLEETKIDVLGNIEIERFQIVYEKDPETQGYVNNPIKEKKPVGNRTLVISEGGKIQEVNTNLANTASEGSVAQNPFLK